MMRVDVFVAKINTSVYFVLRPLLAQQPNTGIEIEEVVEVNISDFNSMIES